MLTSHSESEWANSLTVTLYIFVLLSNAALLVSEHNDVKELCLPNCPVYANNLTHSQFPNFDDKLRWKLIFDGSFIRLLTS